MSLLDRASSLETANIKSMDTSNTRTSNHER